VSDSEFDIFIQNDINSSGYTDWFHFAMTVAETTPESIKFNIVNFVCKFITAR